MTDHQDKAGETAPLKALSEELNTAHALLSETRARVTEGQPVWQRFEWLKTLLVRERDEAASLQFAAEAEIEAWKAKLRESEHRRCAAENRAEALRLELDAALSRLSAPQGETKDQENNTRVAPLKAGDDGQDLPRRG